MDGESQKAHEVWTNTQRTDTHTRAINEKRSHQFEIKQGVLYEAVWRKEIKARNYVIIL